MFIATMKKIFEIAIRFFKPKKYLSVEQEPKAEIKYEPMKKAPKDSKLSDVSHSIKSDYGFIANRFTRKRLVKLGLPMNRYYNGTYKER